MNPVRTVPLLDALEDVSRLANKIPQSNFLPAGRIPVVDQGQSRVAGYTDDEKAVVSSEVALILFGDHTRAIKYVDFPFAVGADGVKLLRARSDFDPRYVYHFLRARPVASVGYSRHFKFLKELRVPKPELGEQRRIAAILDQADAVRTKRRRALAHHDALPQSVLAGYVRGSGRTEAWRPLGESLQFLTSGSRGWSGHYASSGSKFIRIQNLRGGLIDFSDAAYVQAPDTAEARRTRVEVGDVLVSITADLGRTGVVESSMADAYISQHLALLRQNHYCPEFLSLFIESSAGARQLMKINRGQTKAGLNFDNIRSLLIPQLSNADQDRFVEAVRATRDQRGLLQAQVAAEDELFASLQARAFRGDL